jgi:dolichol-phosphate mannosyltransferase
VLPAYNESKSIPLILDQLKLLVDDTYNLDLRVILIDDGSSDNTAEVASQRSWQLPIEVIRNETNLGLAETFMRGMTEAANRAKEGDIVVCMDADNSHIPGQIMRMLRNIREGRDVVIASRYQHGAVVKGVPLSRRFLSRAMSLLFRLVYPIKGVRDYSCGYRAYKAEFLQKILADYSQHLFAKEGFACMVGILLRMAKVGAICGEVPIILRYDQKAGASKMKVGVTIMRTLLVLMRERFGHVNKAHYQLSGGRKNDL